jgi:hypothetical protein
MNQEFSKGDCIRRLEEVKCSPMAPTATAAPAISIHSVESFVWAN